MSTNNEVQAFLITVSADGKTSALLTVNRLEMNAKIAEAIKEHNQMTIEIKQYTTTKAEFFEDLKKLTSEVSKW